MTTTDEPSATPSDDDDDGSLRDWARATLWDGEGDADEQGKKPILFRLVGACLHHLEPGCMLGEDVVDAYHRCLWYWCLGDLSPAQSEYDLAPTSVFRRLMEVDGDRPPPPSLGERLARHRVCFWPALQSDHWSLLILVPRVQRVYVVDSLRAAGGPVDVPDRLWETLRASSGDPWDQPAVAIPCHPQDRTGNDCGLHVLQNAEALFVLRRLLPWERQVPDACSLVPSPCCTDMMENRRLVQGLLTDLFVAPVDDESAWRRICLDRRRCLTSPIQQPAK